MYGFARAGGADTAHLYDSDSDTSRDTFVGKATYSLLSGAGFYNRADGFDEVYGHASADGSGDRAYLFDSVGDDYLEADGSVDPSRAALSGADQRIEVYDFSWVRATAENGGTNTKHVVEPLDYVLETIGGWTDI